MPVTEQIEKEEEPTLENTFKKAKDISIQKHLKLLVWGKPGLGKTYLSLSCKPPIWVISTEPETVISNRSSWPKSNNFMRLGLVS